MQKRFSSIGASCAVALTCVTTAAATDAGTRPHRGRLTDLHVHSYGN